MIDKEDFQNLFPDWFLQIWKWFWDLLNRLGIIVTVAGTSGVIGFIQLLRRDTRWITWVTILLCVLLSGLLFLRYWNISRKKVIFGLFLSSCFIVLIPSGWLIYQNLPPQEAIILITNFDGDENIKIDNLIADEIEKLTQNDSRIKISYSDEIIPFKQGRKIAKKIGKDHKATVVIWGLQGSNNKEKVYYVRLTLLKPTGKLFLGKSLRDGDPQIIPASEFDEFPRQLRYAKNISFHALLAVAMTEASLDNWDKAIELINKLLIQVEEPLDRSAVFDILTMFYMVKGDYEKALENNNEALSLQEKNHNPNTLSLRGFILWGRNDYEQAFTYLNEALKIQPDNPQLLNHLGAFLIYQGDYNQALDYFNKSLKIQPNNINSLNNRGVVFLDQKNYKAAINEFKKVIDQAQADNYDSLRVNSYYLQLADAYCKHNNFELCIDGYSHIIDSISVFEKINLNISPGKVQLKKRMQLYQAYHKRALAYQQKGELTLAIHDFNQEIKLLISFLDKPINPQIETDNNLLLAWAYNNRGIAYHHKSISAPFHYSRSKGYSKKRLLDFAINDFNTALELAEFQNAYINRARAYIDQKEFDLALADLDTVMCFRYLDRAQAYQKQGNFKSSLADYHRSLELDLNSYAAYVYRGILLSTAFIELQNVNVFETLNKALDDFHAAIKLQPNNSIAYRHSAEIYQRWSLLLLNNDNNRQKALEFAIHQLTKAIDLEQNSDDYMLRGQIYSDLGNLQSAEKDFEKVIEIGSNCISNNCEAYIELGKVYKKMGELELARDRFNHSINYFTQIINFGYNNPENYFWRGITYDEIGNFELALNDYSKAIALNPNNINYKFFKLDLIRNNAKTSLYDKKNNSQEAVNQIIIEEELKKEDDILKKIKSELENENNIDPENNSIVINNQSHIEDQIAEYNEDIAEVQLLRGIVYSYQGDQQNAVSDFQQVLQLTNNSMIRQEAQQQLQKLCLQTGHRPLHCAGV